MASDWAFPYQSPPQTDKGVFNFRQSPHHIDKWLCLSLVLSCSPGREDLASSPETHSLSAFPIAALVRAEVGEAKGPSTSIRGLQRPRRSGAGYSSSEQTPERTREWQAGPLPVIPLFAELLLEVAQGQALSLQHPPIWNFFSTEKVGDNQLAGLECVDTCQFLWLFVIFRSQAWAGEGCGSCLPSGQVVPVPLLTGHAAPLFLRLRHLGQPAASFL